ncbi:hypothetical protein PSTG_00113 [Puccinia striiformis f. sp. tritici PST-78]|uniref:Secreted protein n=1 Tax=Puccinia striiformis f. sp. tritici PST-78 TaxID=1165861 RepID=A0A0L0W5N7_9BASI|nr:hypothetical protein PSTG_00113 [Puccinia striiformis f. sp. tritici PST-78]
MFSKLLLFPSVISMMVSGSLAIYCYSGTVVDKEECHGAIAQIVYQEDGTLGTASKYFGYVFGNCSINLLNPINVSPTKKQVHDGYNKILNFCKPRAGTGDLLNDTTIHLNIGNRGFGPFAPYESDFPVHKETCGLNKKAPAINKEDCVQAYNSIPLSAKGTFLTDGKIATEAVEKTHGTCTINIYSSDGSILIGTSEHVRPVFGKLLDKCNDVSGVVSIKEGIQGQNGRLFVKFRNSLPCGDGEPNTQVCH